MEDKIDKAIDLLLTSFKSGGAPKCDDSLKFSQAILNLAHAKQILEGKPKKPTS